MRNIPADKFSGSKPNPITYRLEEIKEMAKEILDRYSSLRIFILKGNMGAGKTTLVRELVKALGLESPVSSPTYSFIQDYSQKGLRVYHIDLFRAKTAAEVFDFGFWEFLSPENYLFIEWPELIEPYLEAPYVEIKLEILNSKNRILYLNHYLEGFRESSSCV